MYNDILNQILLSPNESEIQPAIECWLKANDLHFKYCNNMQYKILNHNVKRASVMLYPTKHKIMVQVNGKSYVTTAKASTLIAIAKGEVAFRREGE